MKKFASILFSLILTVAAFGSSSVLGVWAYDEELNAKVAASVMKEPLKKAFAPAFGLAAMRDFEVTITETSIQFRVVPDDVKFSLKVDKLADRSVVSEDKEWQFELEGDSLFIRVEGYKIFFRRAKAKIEANKASEPTATNPPPSTTPPAPLAHL